MKKSHDEKILSEESLKGESFSSNVHNQELLVEEVKGVTSGYEYEIPHRYGVDMLVFMPVNLETSFVYWEVTQTLMETNHVSMERLITKVYEIDETQERELFEFNVGVEVGKYYLHIRSSMNNVQAKMGFYNEKGEFVVLLVSNIFRMPNDRIEFSDDEVWMSVDEKTREIIRASMSKTQDGLSSKTLFKEKIIESSRLRGYSSSDLIKRGK